MIRIQELIFNEKSTPTGRYDKHLSAKLSCIQKLIIEKTSKTTGIFPFTDSGIQ